MKKTLVASILGLATAVSVMAQSRIALNTYTAVSPYPTITYGVGSGGTLGADVTGGFTVGFYYSTTSATFEGGTTQGGANTAVPGGSFVLATGTGSTASIVPSFPGLFLPTANAEFTIPGVVPTAYLVVVAYNGANYADSLVRGHSAVFTLAPNTTAFGPGTDIGNSMSGFSVVQVPEPSTFALAGLGLASLLIFRRRK